MKILTLCVILVTLPLIAQDFSEGEVREISLGLVVGAQGDSLLLVDDGKVYVPNLAFASYVDENGNMVSTAISYPFTASLVLNNATGGLGTEARSPSRTSVSVIKIHQFYEIVDGRLAKRNFD